MTYTRRDAPFLIAMGIILVFLAWGVAALVVWLVTDTIGLMR